MTIREEILHLSSNELNEVYYLLDKCLEILNPEDESLLDLSSNGKEMTFQIRLARTSILSRIIELDTLNIPSKSLEDAESKQDAKKFLTHADMIYLYIGDKLHSQTSTRRNKIRRTRKVI